MVTRRQKIWTYVQELEWTATHKDRFVFFFCIFEINRCAIVAVKVTCKKTKDLFEYFSAWASYQNTKWGEKENPHPDCFVWFLYCKDTTYYYELFFFLDDKLWIWTGIGIWKIDVNHTIITHTHIHKLHFHFNNLKNCFLWFFLYK